MQVDKNDTADRRGSQGSHPSDSDSTSQLHSQLRDKLQKLAKWRIDHASIVFLKDAPEFLGGFAAVSQAVLVSAPSSEISEDDSTDTGEENTSDGTSPRRKAVAVKKLKIENGKDKERVLRLALREAGFLTELRADNIIELEGFVEDLSEDRVWLIFPWAANGNLKDFVASADWEIPERMHMISDVVDGVEYLHSQNPPVCHGDLKSANVLVISNYRAVITDFGSARRLRKKEPPMHPEKSGNGALPTLLLETTFCESTKTMTLTGNQYTLRWAAPELLIENEPGLWSDIWALGWIFYEVMTNSIPFQNIQEDAVVAIHVIHGKLPSVADHSSMPMMRPDPQRASNTPGSQARSPELLMELGDMHRSQNDYINASKYYTEALDIYTGTADDARKASALLGLAHIHKGQTDYPEAVTCYEKAAQIFTVIGDRRGRAEGLWGLAEVHRLQAEPSEAVTLYSEVIQICNDIEDREGRADALRGLAHVHLDQNEYDKAFPLFSEAIQIFTEVGNRKGRADALWGAAEVYRGQNQYIQVVQLLSESLQICIDIGDNVGSAWALMSLANAHHDQDQHEDARRLYTRAAGVFEGIGFAQDAADALNAAADARQRLRKPEEAES